MEKQAGPGELSVEDGSLILSDGVTVLIPAYNEEGGVGPVLDELHELMEASNLLYEVLVIDDGSTDDTAGVVRVNGKATLIQHTVNSGYGAALKTGLRHAKYGLIAIADADGTYPVARLPEMIGPVARRETDMVVGARTGENVSIPLIRRPAKWVIRKLAELAAGQRIPDINSGLRVFRKTIAFQFMNLFPSGFSFTTTITLAMLTNQYTVQYISVDYLDRTGRSKIRPIRDTLNFVKLILRIALYFAPLKIFLSLSAFLLLSSLGIGVYTFVVVGRIADVTTVLLALTALQIGVVGLLAELINKRLPNLYRGE